MSLHSSAYFFQASFSKATTGSVSATTMNRQRSSWACQRCQRSRAECDGIAHWERCSACSAAGTECVFARRGKLLLSTVRLHYSTSSGIDIERAKDILRSKLAKSDSTMSVPGPPTVVHHSDQATTEVVMHSAGPSIKHYANADFTSSVDASISKKSNVPSSYTLSLVPGKDVTNVNDNRPVPSVSPPVSVSWPEFRRLHAAGPLDPEEVLHQDLTQPWTPPVLLITCYYFLLRRHIATAWTCWTLHPCYSTKTRFGRARPSNPSFQLRPRLYALRHLPMVQDPAISIPPLQYRSPAHRISAPP